MEAQWPAPRLTIVAGTDVTMERTHGQATTPCAEANTCSSGSKQSHAGPIAATDCARSQLMPDLLFTYLQPLTLEGISLTLTYFKQIATAGQQCGLSSALKLPLAASRSLP